MRITKVCFQWSYPVGRIMKQYIAPMHDKAVFSADSLLPEDCPEPKKQWKSREKRSIIGYMENPTLIHEDMDRMRL